LEISQNIEFLEDSEGGYLGFLSLVNFDVRELALQMTLIDSRYFKQIRLTELVGQAWNKNKRKAPHVIRFISHTNRVTDWVVSSILSEESPKQRAKILTNFINLLSALKNYRNFSSIMAVISALNSSAISRLKLTHNMLNMKHIKMASAFSEMMRSVSSFKAYRTALRSSNEPCIPFMGVTLSDLTFLEDGNPDFITDQNFNLHRIRTQISSASFENLSTSSPTSPFSPLSPTFPTSASPSLTPSQTSPLPPIKPTNGENPENKQAPVGSNPSKDLINWQKRTLLARVLLEFTEDQRLCKYSIEETPMCASFLKRINDVARQGVDFYELSLKLEPRQSAREPFKEKH